MSELQRWADNYTESRKSEWNKKFQEALKSWQIPALKEALAVIEKEYQSDKRTILAISKQEKIDLASKLWLDWSASFSNLIKKIKWLESTKKDETVKPTEVPTKEEKPKESHVKPTEAPLQVQQEKPIPETVQEESFMDKTWRFFTWKLDINTLPKEDQATIKNLQDAWFKLKPVEWQKWVYEIDMNWYDNSKIKIEEKEVKLITDAIKIKDYNLNITFEKKDIILKLNQVNELININFELKWFSELSWHRELYQNQRYEQLITRKQEIEWPNWIML